MPTDEPTATHSFDDRVAVITGAASGMGAATARRLAAEGARVALLSRREDLLVELAGEIEAVGGRALALPTDVTDEDAVLAAAERIAAELGTSDLVVSSAGVMLPGPLETQSTEEWRRMLDINVLGVMNVARAFAPALRAAASAGRPADLINISSIGAKVVFPGYAVYGGSKAAVNQITATIRAELAPLGVRVTNLEPGLTDTELGDHITDAGKREELAGMFEAIPALHAEDVADLVAFLVGRPLHVNVPSVELAPTRQA